MADTQEPPHLPLAELVVSVERHGHLDNILNYVRSIHDCIDPDMFRIPRGRLEDLCWCFERDEGDDHTGFTVMVSYDDLFMLEIITSAAYEYSLRKSTGRRVDGITNLGFEDVLKWLARARNQLFTSKTP
ncbi:hypothetical protein [Nitrospira moscoviensis]|uniref:Uncharacterized protein n=1 Tax=Nitrospira moscoviensis TaxID=42253 RepID=A0A0K2GBF7_NITMO|nr:hypothetical protein [Nitrospira moscoviensis]ALA57907.1 hypothetical protein NITMOv2_1480 [Nitrospira moscoviensis]